MCRGAYNFLVPGFYPAGNELGTMISGREEDGEKEGGFEKVDAVRSNLIAVVRYFRGDLRYGTSGWLHDGGADDEVIKEEGERGA